MFVNAESAFTTGINNDMTVNTAEGPVTYRKVAGEWTSPHGDSVNIFTDNRGDVFPGIWDTENRKMFSIDWMEFCALLAPEFPTPRCQRSFVPTIWWEGADMETCFFADRYWFRERGSWEDWQACSLTEFAAIRREQEMAYYAQLEWEEEHLPQ
jgi:hypothetical protein